MANEKIPLVGTNIIEAKVFGELVQRELRCVLEGCNERIEGVETQEEKNVIKMAQTMTMAMILGDSLNEVRSDSLDEAMKAISVLILKGSHGFSEALEILKVHQLLH